MRICFDLDGTLCSQYDGSGYDNCAPHKEMIEVINKLHDNGHTIIIRTARGMGMYNGDLGKIYSVFYNFTKDQLERWGVRFDELRLGKFDADLFVDDKAFRVNEDGTSAQELEEFINELNKKYSCDSCKGRK